MQIIENKIMSYEAFNLKYPGFGGYLPWFYVNSGEMIPTQDFQDKVPGIYLYYI